MPLFLIERNFAQDLVVSDADAAHVREINDEIGIQWLYSFLSADKRKTYCLYEAPNAEAIRIAARRLDIPADAIIPVSELRPEQFGAGVAADRNPPASEEAGFAMTDGPVNSAGHPSTDTPSASRPASCC